MAGPRIWIKTDDCTGLAFGGNKARQHEYILGDAINEGVDVIIQGAASQSNQSLQLAAAAARLGIRCILMPRMDARYSELQGNQLIARRFGAEIVHIAATASAKQAKEDMASRLRAQGLKPAILGMGSERAISLAAVAYVGAMCELLDQFDEKGEPFPTHIYCTSQGSTQAGFMAAKRLLGLVMYIRGINPMDARNEAYEPPEAITHLCEAAADILGFTIDVAANEVDNSTDWVCEDYGLSSPEAQAAGDLLVECEGILVDPVYS